MNKLKELFQTMQADVQESHHLADGYLKLLADVMTETNEEQKDKIIFNLHKIQGSETLHYKT